MLPSYMQANAAHEAMFNVNTFSGLNITQSFKVDDDASINAVVALSPIQFDVKPDGRGGAQKVRNQTKMWKLGYEKSNENGTIMASIGTSKFLLFHFKPTPNFALGAQLADYHGVVNPSFSASQMSKYNHIKFNIIFKGQRPISVVDNKFAFFDFSKIVTQDMIATFGVPDCSFGVQIVKRNIENPNTRKTTSSLSYAGMFQRCWDDRKSMFEIAAIHNSNEVQSQDSVVGRFQRQITPCWRAGVSAKVDSMLNSTIQFTYKANLGKYVVHSSIESHGIIESFIRRDITDQLKLVATASVNHPLRSYLFGLGLNFDMK